MSPHSPQPVRFCVTSVHFSNPPFLTSVQSHCHLKTPSLSLPQVLCTCCPSSPLSPVLTPAGSISTSRSQLQCHLLRPSPATLPNSPTLLFQGGSTLLGFLYKSTSECPCAFIHVYCPFPQGVVSTRVSPCLVCALLCPRVQVRAWHTLVANKHVLKEFSNRDQPSLLYHHALWQKDHSLTESRVPSECLEQVPPFINCLW